VKPDALPGLATGSNPLPIHQVLAAMNLDWSRVTTFDWKKTKPLEIVA
jgi:6-phosphogluconolactonase/glucosamine-6-phosphate isomerase/deaminase